jgi:hypothetical protein
MTVACIVRNGNTTTVACIVGIWEYLWSQAIKPTTTLACRVGIWEYLWSLAIKLTTTVACKYSCNMGIWEYGNMCTGH